MEGLNTLRKNGTWEVVNLPIDQKTVGCKWVFIMKCKANGSVERFKARRAWLGGSLKHMGLITKKPLLQLPK